MCKFLGSISSWQNFEAMDGPVLKLLDGPCYSSVLQLSFVWKIKECTSSRCPFVIVEPTLQSWFHCWFVCRFPLVLNCVKYIFVSIEMITFFFILLTCCIVLTDFLMLNQPCISLINLIYPWHCEFLYLIWQYFVKSVVSVQNEFFGSCSDLV